MFLVLSPRRFLTITLQHCRLNSHVRKARFKKCPADGEAGQ